VANDPGLKSKKIRGGWNVVEDTPALTAVPVAPTSEPSSTLSLSWHELLEAVSTVFERSILSQYESGGCDLKPEQRTAVLEAILGDLSLSVPNLGLLFAELHKPSENGWTLASSFPAIVRSTQDWLASQGVQIEPPKLSTKMQSMLDRFNGLLTGAEACPHDSGRVSKDSYESSNYEKSARTPVQSRRPKIDR
jgi:hypothetical protein